MGLQVYINSLAHGLLIKFGIPHKDEMHRNIVALKTTDPI